MYRSSSLNSSNNSSNHSSNLRPIMSDSRRSSHHELTPDLEDMKVSAHVFTVRFLEQLDSALYSVDKKLVTDRQEWV